MILSMCWMNVSTKDPHLHSLQLSQIRSARFYVMYLCLGLSKICKDFRKLLLAIICRCFDKAKRKTKIRPGCFNFGNSSVKIHKVWASNGNSLQMCILFYDYIKFNKCLCFVPFPDFCRPCGTMAKFPLVTWLNGKWGNSRANTWTFYLLWLFTSFGSHDLDINLLSIYGRVILISISYPQ